MISKEFEIILEATVRQAQALRHEYLVAEHILFTLLHDEKGVEIITCCGGDIGRMKSSLELFFEKHVPKLPEANDESPRPTTGFHRVIQRALLHVRSAGREQADAGDILASLFLEEDSPAVSMLLSEGITRLDVLDYISHGKKKQGDDVTAEKEAEPGAVRQGREERPVRDPLKLFAINLLERAEKGEIDPLVGRENELERTLQVLSRRRKNNIVFVGEPGVGKTALAEGLALRIHRGKVPDALRGVPVFALDISGLLAGTKYRGDFEARFKATIRSIEKIPGAIIFIDEIHTIVGAGATSGGSLDASNILKPVLLSGRVRCIGATTYEEYKNHFEKDRALSRRFQKIEIQEPGVSETVSILRGLKAYYEHFHGVTYTDRALKAAAELSGKYINDKYLPDKAIDVIDEAGALLKLSPSFPKKKTIGTREVEAVVAKMAKIPSRTLSTSDRDKLKSLGDELKQAVFGQDRAIASLVSAIRRSRAGLGAPERPVGSFLFTGPTGVGKTEIARQTASVLGVHFMRFDMSEYMEKHAVARLIGAPPGYVGFDQGGLLTDAVRKHPYSVLLLDEIEKAHPDIFNILLQVMDYATLTDNNGKKADFRNLILVMTSNAGSQDREKSSIGFGDRSSDTHSHGEDAIKRLFSPEFRNRLDGIITFDPLNPEIMKKVVGKLLREFECQLLAKKVSLIVTAEAREWLAVKGYDPRYGARPLTRVIQAEIKDVLSEEILFGKLEGGGNVMVDREGDRLCFTYPHSSA